MNLLARSQDFVTNFFAFTSDGDISKSLSTELTDACDGVRGYFKKMVNLWVCYKPMCLFGINDITSRLHVLFTSESDAVDSALIDERERDLRLSLPFI